MSSSAFSPNAAGRFALLATSAKSLALIDRQRLLGSLQGVASWLETATDTARGLGVGHRVAVYLSDGRMNWMYPHGNSGEVISAWIELGEILERPEYQARALDYGAGLLDDPVTGLYRGEVREAHGLAWYWTDSGSYTCGYSMRMPVHFLRLYEKSGETRFLDICDVIGRTMLHRQTASGLVDASWSPRRGWQEGGTRVGCRYAYSLATFATLFKITGDAAYRQAYERAVEALLAMQNEDGSFYQHYEVATGEPSPNECSIKPFFFSYLFNAMMEAYEAMGDARLLGVAERLGGYLAGLYYYRRSIPYCLGETLLPTDRVEADTAVHDLANGLLWLYSLNGNAVFLDLGVQLWIDAWLSQAEMPEKPGWHGAILHGVNPALCVPVEGVPEDREHLQYDSTRIAKCTLWMIVNHLFATRRLLDLKPVTK